MINRGKMFKRSVLIGVFHCQISSELYQLYLLLTHKRDQVELYF